MAMTVPDIGRFCAPIRKALRALPKRIRVIAEPGRYIAGPAAIAVAAVMGRAQREGLWWYYLDDGVYGSYSGQLYDHARYPIRALREGPLHASVLAGPTCDSIDVIAEDVRLPKLKEGDLVVGSAMGAYTWAHRLGVQFLPQAHGRLGKRDRPATRAACLESDVRAMTVSDHVAGAAAERGVAVIIDVFRAASLQCYAFAQGAERVISGSRGGDAPGELEARAPGLAAGR